MQRIKDQRTPITRKRRPTTPTGPARRRGGGPGACAALIVIIASGLLASSAQAIAPISVDTAFNGGSVTVPFPTPAGGSGGSGPIATATAVQADGKLLVAGYSSAVSDTTVAEFDVARYNANGTIDTSFGTGTTPGFAQVQPIPGADNEPTAIVIDALGRIVVVGPSIPGGSQPAPATSIVRLTSSGALDGRFGTGGIVTDTTTGTLNSNGEAEALQPDGHIVVLNFATGGVLRYAATGTRDSAFNGNTGIATLPMSPHGGLVTQPTDGKIVVGSDNAGKVVVYRLNADGSTDSSFGDLGTPGLTTVAPDAGATEVGAAAALDNTGDILVAGHSNANDLLVKLTPNGALASGFGSGGRRVTAPPAGYQSQFSGALVHDPFETVVTLGGRLQGEALTPLAIALDPATGSGGSSANSAVIPVRSAAASGAFSASGGTIAIAGTGAGGGSAATLAALTAGAETASTNTGGSSGSNSRAAASLCSLSSSGAGRPCADLAITRIVTGGFAARADEASEDLHLLGSLAGNHLISNELFNVGMSTLAGRAGVHDNFAVNAPIVFRLSVVNNGDDPGSCETVTVAFRAVTRSLPCSHTVIAPHSHADIRVGPIVPAVSPSILRFTLTIVTTSPSDPNTTNNTGHARVRIYDPARVRPLTYNADGFDGTASSTVATGGSLAGQIAAAIPRAPRIAHVDIALLRVAGSARAAAVKRTHRKPSRCIWLASAQGNFRTLPAIFGVCTTKVWRRTGGTTRWSYPLHRPLAPGRYVLYVRAVDAYGGYQVQFSAARHNRIAFRVLPGQSGEEPETDPLHRLAQALDARHL